MVVPASLLVIDTSCYYSKTENEKTDFSVNKLKRDLNLWPYQLVSWLEQGKVKHFTILFLATQSNETYSNERLYLLHGHTCFCVNFYMENVVNWCLDLKKVNYDLLQWAHTSLPHSEDLSFPLAPPALCGPSAVYLNSSISQSPAFSRRRSEHTDRNIKL